MRIRYLLALLASQALGDAAHSAPVAPINLPALIGGADLAVAAFIRGRGHGLSAEVQIDSVLKGNPKIDLSPVASLLGRELNSADWLYGIFFLRSSTSGFTTMTVPPYNKDIAFVRAAPVRYSIKELGVDPLALVASRVASIYNIPLRVIADPKFGLAPGHLALFDFSPDGPGNNDSGARLHAADEMERASFVYDDALQVLRSVPHEVARPILKDIIDHDQEAVGREYALASLTFTWDTSRLATMQNYLLKPIADAAGAHEEVRVSIEMAKLRPEDEGFLLVMSRSAISSFREVAMERLAHYDSEDSLRVLAGGLNDTESSVRRAAAASICQRTNNCNPTNAMGRAILLK